MAVLLCFSSFPKKILLGSMIRVSIKQIKESDRESLFERIRLLKDNINQAYALILDERKILLPIDVSLQDQVDMLTRLCYDTEDMIVKFEFIMSLKSSAWSRLEKSKEVYNLKRQLLSVATRLGNAISGLQRSLPVKPLQTPSSLGHNKIFLSHQRKPEPLTGREDDIKAIIKQLTSDDIKSSGVSIVGMNGVGKSALVPEILNRKAVIYSYDLILRTSLEGPFNSEEISKQLLKSYMEAEYVPHCNYTSMYQRLHKCRWLIALDNLSDVTYTEWSDFQSLCYSSENGTFLITTVNYNIPVVTKTTRYCLHPLSDECCRDVILRKARMENSHDRSLPLETAILAKRCGGLPLVANFMGCHLHDEDKRRTMLDRDLWEVPEFQREILQTLASTYSMLKPHHLRKCFAYFSLFPQDYHFNKEDLIHLWIGEGFIQCREESSLSLERVGKQYFETLVRWSILQPCNSEQDLYKIHELTHKLAKHVASKTCLWLDEEAASSQTLAINTRHLSLSCNLEQDYMKNIEKLKGLRTLLPLGYNGPFPGSLFKRLLCIRVLSFKHTDVTEVPESISKLKLLRYLDISDTKIRELPEVVCTLSNLQILKLRNTTELHQLPHNFNRLMKLRYIDWDINTMKILSVPYRIGSLTSLQRLPLFKVGHKAGYSIIELRDMVYLQGSICITNLENVKTIEEAENAKLSSKKSLEEIEFDWTSSDDDSEDVLSALRPHESLRKLKITNYCGYEFPKWLGDLHLLETAHLRGCISLNFLPILGQLPALKILCIEAMDHINSLGDTLHKLSPPSSSSSSCSRWFPALELLKLIKLPKLTSLPILEQLTSLRELIIVDCVTFHDSRLDDFSKLSPEFKMTIDGITRECQPLAAHESMIGRIPTAGHDSQLKPMLHDPSIEKSTIGHDISIRTEENQPSTAHGSTVDRIPTVRFDGQLKPTLDDPSIKKPALGQGMIIPTEENKPSEVHGSMVGNIPTAESVGQLKPRLDDSSIKKWTLGQGVNSPTEENKHSAAHGLMVDNIPTTGMDGQLKPTLDDYSSIEVVGKSIKSIEESSVDKCSQVLAGCKKNEMMLHCLLFPKDYKFAKKGLIHLWSAAGFLGYEPIENAGDIFFEFLLVNGFILDHKNKDSSGTNIYQFNVMKIYSYLDKLREGEHSQKWEFKHFEEKIENANLNVNSFAGYSDVSVISGEIDHRSFESFSKYHKLRSLLLLNGSVTTVPSHIFSAFNSLTTLDLSRTGLKELPTSVSYAKKLCYLDLSWTLIERLPDSLADLCELQSLKLEGCTHLFSLPQEMNKLKNLIHLDFDILGQLTSMPEGIGALVKLQTLWAFIVDSVGGCNIKELKNMNNLSGKLCLSGLENVMKLDEAKEAALINKEHLLQLEFRWSSIFKKIKKCNYVEVLEGLEPHKYLEYLQIKCFPGSNFPKWVGDRSYSKLVSIMLYKCEHCKLLPSLGELPKLENLELRDMNGVTRIEDRKPFPNLKKLTIDSMKSLKKWSGLNGDNFPSIDSLTIKHCPKLSTLKLKENGQSSASIPCSQVEIVNCPKLARLPDKLLKRSSPLKLIIEDCPLGHRYQEGGKDRDKINSDAEVLIFQDTPTSDEEIGYSVLEPNFNLEEIGIPRKINE